MLIDSHFQPTSMQSAARALPTVLGAASPLPLQYRAGRPRPFKVTQPEAAQLEQALRLAHSLLDHLGVGVQLPQETPPPPRSPPWARLPGPCPPGAPAQQVEPSAGPPAWITMFPEQEAIARASQDLQVVYLPTVTALGD